MLARVDYLELDIGAVAASLMMRDSFIISGRVPKTIANLMVWRGRVRARPLKPPPDSSSSTPWALTCVPRSPCGKALISV